MSQEGAILPQDVEGSSPGGAASAGSGSFSSSAKPAIEIVNAGSQAASPVINSPEDVDEAMPAAVVSAGTAGSDSGSGSIKLAGEDDIDGGSKPASPVAVHASENNDGSHPSSQVVVLALDAENNNGGESEPASPLVSLALAAESNNDGGSNLASPAVVVHAAEYNDGGSKPARPALVALAAENDGGGSNPASPALVAFAAENNDGGSKPASPEVVLGAGEGNQGEEKEELAGGEGGGEDEDAAGDSGGVAGSNSKSIRMSSSDGDVQGGIKDAPKPVAACGGGGSSSSRGKGKDRGKDKGKGAAAETDHAVHIWTERERRKKMKNMYSTLHSLLPRLPEKADKATIVGEAVDYIKTLEGTIQRLEKLKMERMRAQQLGAGGGSSSSSMAPASPPMRHGAPVPVTREATLADMVHQQAAAAMAARGSVAPLGPFQSWSAPNISLSVTGNEALIGVCTLRQPCGLTKVLYVLEKYRIDVVTLNISSDQDKSLFILHTRISAASARLAETLRMTCEDRYKLTVSEILQLISN